MTRFGGAVSEIQRLQPFINSSNALLESIRSMCNEEGSPLRAHIEVG